jgi:hypothetical protein
MSSDPLFRCPVCRARQTLADTCRRCEADLRLVARAHRRIAYLLSQQQLAHDEPDAARLQRIGAELIILAPRMDRARNDEQ